MIRYFSHALDNCCTGSATYLGSLQRLFVQDEDSGIIEVEYAAGREIILLYHVGNLIKIYHLEGSRSIPIAASNLKDLLVGDGMEIRTLSLPIQAVRAVSQALDWFPPSAALQHNFLSLDAYFSELKTLKFNGLLNINLPDLDGLQLWVDGSPVSSEAVFSTSRGFVDSLPHLRPSISASEKTGNTWVYQAQTDALSWEFVHLRRAVGKLLSETILAYQKLVGQTMINALDYELNVAMRMSYWNFRLVGIELIDHHLFLDIASAQDAYRKLLVYMMNHITRVVGSSLAQRAINEAFEKLGKEDQDSLNKYSFNPVILSNIKKETFG